MWWRSNSWALIPLLALIGLIALRAIDPAPLPEIRNAVFDQYQRLKPRPQSLAKSFVRIVDIDDESLRRVGQWPWSRDIMANLVRALKKRGAVVITLDMVLSEPDRLSSVQLAQRRAFAPLREQLLKIPDTDRTLTAAIADAHVVTGVVLTHQKGAPPPSKIGFGWGGYDPSEFIFAFKGALTNLESFDKAATGIGAINYVVGADQVVRRLPIVLRIGESLIPSLFAETLRVASGARGYKIRTSGASGESGGAQKTGITAIQIGRSAVPTDANGQLLLYYSRSDPARYIPAWRVLDGSVPNGTIRNRIILIGTSAAGLKDLRTTPLARAVPGVEVHAQAIDQVIAGIHLRRPDWANGMELALLALIGFAVMLASLRFGALMSGALFFAAIAGVIAVTWYGFDTYLFLTDPSWIVFCATLMFILTTLLSYFRTERQRNQVRSAFGHYLAPSLVERLARRPDELHLGGELRDLTVMFCDIRGFTGIAERFDAAGLTAVLNAYLTPSTEVILAHGGTIDKYIGDAIMAFWNAPLDRPAHAADACQAALDIIQTVEVLNEKLQIPQKPDEAAAPQLQIAIGINSGLCSVGNMGSEQRFDYSALGDDVNLASRLEGLCRQYHVDIIVGDATREAASEFAMLELDLIRVKGKTKPARMHALLGSRLLKESRPFRELETGHLAMLAAYRAQEWTAARYAVQKLQMTIPAGVPVGLSHYSDMMTDRLGLFETDLELNSLGDAWDGVYLATEK